MTCFCRLFLAFLTALACAGAGQAAQPYVDYFDVGGTPTYNFSGRTFYAQAVPLKRSLSVMDHMIVRIEVRHGDCSPPDYYHVPPLCDRERAEFSGPHVPFGKLSTFEADVLMEPLPGLVATNRYFAIPLQWHGGDDVVGGPIAALNIEPNNATSPTGEILTIGSTYNTTTATDGTGNATRKWIGPAWTRGVFHHILMSVVDGHGYTSGNDANSNPIGTGSIHVEFDGTVILDQQNIVTGYAGNAAGQSAYVKFGFYGAPTTATAEPKVNLRFEAPDFTIQP